MFCKKCGKELPEGTSVSPDCGEILMNGTPVYGQKNGSQQGYSYNQMQSPYEQQPRGSGCAIAALVCGILSVVTCCCSPIINIPFAVAALICGGFGLKSRDRGMAVAGMILGGAGLLLGVIYFAIAFAFEPDFHYDFNFRI